MLTTLEAELLVACQTARAALRATSAALVDYRWELKLLRAVTEAAAVYERSPRMVLEVKGREFHTVLAALRFWQEEIANSDSELPRDSTLATNAGQCEPLTVAEIDALCERINCQPRKGA